jgi:site-specific DNA-cytosine methylase
MANEKHDPSTAEHNGWKLLLSKQTGDEPRIRDIDLAEKLGYARPRDIRKLIERLLKDGRLKDVKVCATVAQTSGGRPGKEYHLTRNQALKVAAHADTNIADIGMRMLRPDELARCQGFPEGFKLVGTQAEQIAAIGHSIPPPLVKALVAANVPRGSS